jgi:ABC-type amino acid transport substrate-binding protein
MKKSAPKGSVVCSRKPQMFWLYSESPGVNYKYTKDAKELILDLVEKKVDYVVLDNLGYSSTYLYLYPALQAYPYLFPQAVIYYENTHQYMLVFDRERAERELTND